MCPRRGNMENVVRSGGDYGGDKGVCLLSSFFLLSMRSMRCSLVF